MGAAARPDGLSARVGRSRRGVLGRGSALPFAVALLLFSLRAGAATDIRKETFEAQGQRRTFYLFVPPAAQPGAPVPLLELSASKSDRFFPLPVVRENRDALAAQGFPVEPAEWPAYSSWDLTFYELEARRINRSAWTFLSKHHLENEPHFEPFPLVIEERP